MSDQELYEIVERRIDQRNRRWMLWALNLTGLVASLALMVAGGDTGYSNLLTSLFLLWGGVFTLHCIWLFMRETRTSDIEDQVAKLRESLYEKPKRLALSDKGELMESVDDAVIDEQRHQKLMSR